MVGDIVRVENHDQFPCDLVLLSTANTNGKCFVMTANLDGETNLKPLFASKETKDCDSPELLANLQAQIECQNPNSDLMSFKGRIKRRKECIFCFRVLVDTLTDNGAGCKTAQNLFNIKLHRLLLLLGFRVCKICWSYTF